MFPSRDESPDVATVIEGMKKQRQKLDETAQRPSTRSKFPAHAAQSPAPRPRPPTPPDPDIPLPSTEDGNISDGTKFDDGRTPSPSLRYTSLSQHPSQQVQPRFKQPAGATARPSPPIKVEGEDGYISDGTDFDDDRTPSPPLRFTGLSQHPNQLVKPRSKQPAGATARPSPRIKVEDEDEDDVNWPNRFPPRRSPSPPVKEEPKDEDGPSGTGQFPTSNLRGA